MEKIEYIFLGKNLLIVDKGSNNIVEYDNFFYMDYKHRNMLWGDTSPNLNKCSIQIIGNNNRVIIGKNICTSPKGQIFIRIFANNSSVKIGINNYINTCLYLNIIPAGPGFQLDNSHISIADENWFNGVSNITSGESNVSVCVGAYNLFANNVLLCNSDSHTIYDISTRKRLNKPQNIKVGNHNWLCSDIKIFKGSVVGNDCVISANSIVTKKFDSNFLLGGVPAKIIKSGINWCQEITTLDYV